MSCRLGISCFAFLAALFCAVGNGLAATFNIADGDVTGLVNAINTANSNGQDDTINLASDGTYVFTTVNNTTTGPCALPIIGFDGTNPNFHSLTINANRSTLTRSSAAGTPDFRIFTAKNVKVFTINNAIITNGRVTGTVTGGGIHINGAVILHHCTIANNYGGGGGGGIYNVANTVQLDGCSVISNTIPQGFGAGIESGGGDLTMVNCTIAANRKENGNLSEGLANIGTNNAAYAQVHNCTFVDNKVYNSALGNVSGGFTTQLHIGSTILSNAPLEHFDPNHFSSNFIQSDGYNLATDNGGGFLTATGDKINSDPKFDPDGIKTAGSVRIIELTFGSPAIDAGNSFGATSDQRGFARIINNQSVPNASDGADIGATEALVDALQYGDPSFVVNTLDDHNDGVCGGVDCTLREALARANTLNGIDHITFAAGLNGTITLTGGELFILDSVTISGPGARLLTISANTQSRVLSVLGGGALNSLFGLTLTGGFVSGQPGSSNVGGGVYIETSLTMSECTLSHNAVIGGSALFGSGADGGMGRGGAIFNGGTLLLDRCTIGGADGNSNNGAFGGDGGAHPSDGEILYHGGKGGPGLGGAIYNDSNASLTINNCTIAGNSAAGGAGGDAAFGGAGGEGAGGIYNLKTVTVTSSTISGNAGLGGAGGDGQFGADGAAGKGVGGVYQKTGTSTIRDSIIAGNTRNRSGGPDVDGTFTSGGFNLIGISNGGSGFTGTSDQTGTLASPINPVLGPVQNNGGPTNTMALLNGSPALDKGFAFGNSIDQRFQARPKDNPSTPNATGGDGSDIGAFEADTNVVGPTPTATATATPTATATATANPNPTATATATAAPTATATASPSSSPTPSPPHLLNIATRLRVQTGDNVLIGGFIITGTDPKQLVIRGIGPSLAQFFSDPLSDPTLELYQGDTLLATNNDWKESQAEIETTGLQPSNDLESAIVRTLVPGNYTAIVRGNGNSTGIGVVEAYDLSPSANSKLANIATRGFVDTGDNVMIGGFITGGDAQVVIRAIGPSLGNFGISGALQDPTLDLVNANGDVIRSNNNWRESQPNEIAATGLQPGDDRESALIESLPAGNYTAVVRGVGNSTGIGLVEIYDFH